MKDQPELDEKKLSLVTIAGLILVFAPINTALIMLLYSFFRKSENIVDTSLRELGESFSRGSIDFSNMATIGGGMLICGMILLSWVGFKEYRNKKVKK